jgi:hypothetical protein
MKNGIAIRNLAAEQGRKAGELANLDAAGQLPFAFLSPIRLLELWSHLGWLPKCSLLAEALVADFGECGARPLSARS